MGCTDYYDPVRESEDVRRAANSRSLTELGITTPVGYRHPDMRACDTCGAVIFVGNLHQVDEMPLARLHREWHDKL